MSDYDQNTAPIPCRDSGLVQPCTPANSRPLCRFAGGDRLRTLMVCGVHPARRLWLSFIVRQKKLRRPLKGVRFRHDDD